MTSTSILRPDIVVVGNRSYRVNPSSLPGLASIDNQQYQVYREEDEADYNTHCDPDDDDEPTCKPQQITSIAESDDKPKLAPQENIDDNDDTIDYNEKDKMFVCEMDIASAFYGVLIGKSAETKQKLEQDTSTRITFPRRDEVGLVKIQGRIKANVQSVRNRMEVIIDRNRQIQPMTHFLSLPICQSQGSQSVKEKYEEFQKKVLEQCGTERGVNSDLFQQTSKLHLTVSTFVLLSKSEIDFIEETLVDSTKTLLAELMPTDKERFLVRMKGLEFMNDDPSFVDVLYAKVQLVNQSQSTRLQNFLDRLNEELSKTSLMKQKFEKLKLHVTLMNSLLRKDDTGILEAQKTARGRVKNAERESFDAKKILQLFGQFDFGQVELTELHLSIMHQPDRQTGYYGCQRKILLKPTANS